MKAVKDEVRECIADQFLPDNFSEIWGDQPAAKLVMDAQESATWDYKNEWPYVKDDYRAGILRLICAFHNTHGGLIVFGVKDDTRKISGNVIEMNVEKFNHILRESLSSPIECVGQTYTLNNKVKVDILLVPKRKIGKPPVAFKVKMGKYREDTVWIRTQDEVLEAKSEDWPFLYGSRNEEAEPEQTGGQLNHKLPENPSTMKQFVGRHYVFKELWSWLGATQEPRQFLWGSGGSGKSVIAWEFAQIVANNAPEFPTGTGGRIDQVIFLSAKQRALDTTSGRVVETGSDFQTAEGLFRLLLQTGEWTTEENLRSMSQDDLEREIKEMMDTITLLIVIDDIDTLTNQGKDPGIDVLYRLAIQSKNQPKILYTLRNMPSHSISHAIEVPGLNDEEYDEFVSKCCSQFGQRVPKGEPLEQDLKQATEQRPLLIEAVIGLRRSVSTYKEALDLLRGQHSGGEIRKYLFEREYDPLSIPARCVLAALSINNKAIKSEDIRVSTGLSKQQVRDAIGETTEMFLRPTITDKDETVYSLGQATRDYLSEVSKKLDDYPQIKANLTSRLNSHISPLDIIFPRLKGAVIKELARKNPEGALALIEKEIEDAEPKLLAHPGFRSLCGTVYAIQDPPQVSKARQSFQISNNFEPLDTFSLRSWFFMETQSGHGLGEALDICKKVTSSSKYSVAIQAEFWSKTGKVHRMLADNSADADSEESLTQYETMLHSQMKAYNLFIKIKDGQELETKLTESSLLGFAANSAWKFSQVCIAQGRADKFCDFWEAQQIEQNYIDPLCRPIREIYRQLLGEKLSNPGSQGREISIIEGIFVPGRKPPHSSKKGAVKRAKWKNLNLQKVTNRELEKLRSA